MQPRRSGHRRRPGASPYTARLVTRRPMLGCLFEIVETLVLTLDHLLCHPDVRRPAVQGPAAVDGAHAGARPVRPGRQADAALRHVQARRHRRVQAAARLGVQEDDTPFIKRVIGLGGDTVDIRDGSVVHQRHPARRAVHLRRAPTSRPSRRPSSGDEHRWVIPTGELFLMGDHRQNSADSRDLRAGRRDAGHRPRVAALLADRRVRDPPDADLPGAGADVPMSDRREPGPRGGRARGRGRRRRGRVRPECPDGHLRPGHRHARRRRSWPIRPAGTAGPRRTPRRRGPGRLPAVDRGPRPRGVRTGGSLLGWPTDAFLAAARRPSSGTAATASVPRPPDRRPLRRPGSRWRPWPSCRSSTGRDILRVGIGLCLLLSGVPCWSGSASAARPTSSSRS